MRRICVKKQNGYMLILTVLFLMGLGGVVAAGFTQDLKNQADRERFLHNERVLREAKRALLMYAYRYPQDNPGRGPGRLPCPDTNNDGSPNPTFNCINGSGVIGRLPWNDPDLGVPELLDASGERLWYAVSRNFSNNISPATSDVINSNTVGTITLFDQSGGVVYDGAVDGIAAVIIAPGPALRRDEDATDDYEYIQDHIADPNDPRNYLDTFNGNNDDDIVTPPVNWDFDNALFNNGQSDTDDDGFMPGWLVDRDVSDTVVNDQMIVITSDEVIAMAQKATLEAYRDAIEDYLANTGGIYPWLDSWPGSLPTRFDADINTFKGRVPSLFGQYFTATGAVSESIITDLQISLVIDGYTVNHQVPASATPDVSFDAAGDLVTSFAPGYTITRYYWDGHPSSTPTLTMDGVFELCPVVTDTEEDCNQDTSGNFIGGSSSDVWLQVYRVTVTFTSIDNPFEFQNSDLEALPPAYTPADAASHAYVSRRYNNNSGFMGVVEDYDQDFQSSFNVQSTNPLVFNGPDTLTVGLIYYPELPRWAIDNNWHHGVQFTIAEDYRPGGNNTDCTTNGCLVVNNLAGVNNDKIALLVIADEIDDLADDNAPGFQDDWAAQFEPENDISNLVYDRLAGNDTVYIVQ